MDTKPFIKSLEEKRSGIEKPIKIGRESPSLLRQEKQLLLKIGHPDAIYTFVKTWLSSFQLFLFIILGNHHKYLFKKNSYNYLLQY